MFTHTQEMIRMVCGGDVLSYCYIKQITIFTKSIEVQREREEGGRER